jgi:hypothetical protein
LDGTNGIDGLDGKDGADGTAGDIPAEDINGDATVDAKDCTGLMGPAGPQGPIGPQGPAGPGSLIFTSSTGVVTTLTDTCIPMTSAEITVDAPGPGVVLVMAHADLSIFHTLGTSDYWRVALSDTPGDCTGAAWRADGKIADTWGSDAAPAHVSLQRVFGIPATGTFTYYLNAYMVLGSGDGDVHDYSNMVAIFFPS